MTNETDEFRAFVVAWLAGLLATPPDADAVARYREPEAAALFDALALELDCAEAITTLRAALTTDASPREVALDLSVAHTRLFEGVNGTVAVPLCESAYTGQRWVDQATHDVAALLRRVGLAMRGGGLDGAVGHVGDVVQARSCACHSFGNGGNQHAEGT